MRADSPGYLCDSCMRATIFERYATGDRLKPFQYWTPQFRCPRQKTSRASGRCLASTPECSFSGCRLFRGVSPTLPLEVFRDRNL